MLYRVIRGPLGKRMKKIKAGKYTIPIWLIAIILAVILGSALAYQVWINVNVQVEIKDPIQILSYPQQLSFYPRETKEFNITLNNQSKTTYYVTLNFSLKSTDDTDPFGNVTESWSKQTFVVVAGQAKMKAVITASETSTAKNYTLTVSIIRIELLPKPSGFIVH